ncbi:MAG TPA: CHASE2 domain-containing protein, partial [Elusimicrobiales bacterium]|nr:CHASE2 domain-containing protein [Elusimicrobiales bacterium]
MYDKAKDQVNRARDKAGAALKWYSLRKQAVHGWAHVALPLALLVSLIAIKSSGWEWAENLQNRAFDAFVRMKPRVYRPVPVRVLDIDDESLSRLGQWPWPRTLLARLVEKLGASGAAAIAFDAVFAEPDRTSPASVIASWPAIPEVLALKRAGDRLPDNDRSFARAVRGAAVVAGFTLTETPNGADPMAKASFAYGGGDPAPWLRPDFPGAVVNLPEIERAAAGNGSFSFMPEPDGVVRRVPLLFLKGGRILPSLVLEALRVAQGASGYQIKSSGASGETGGNTGISRVKAGEFVIPTDGSGKVWVYPTAEAPERTLPAWRVLEKDFNPEAVRGTILFVGTSAAGLKDLRVTALDPRAPGVDVHANAAEQIMLGDYLERPDWAAGAEIVYMLLLGGLLVA